MAKIILPNVRKQFVPDAGHTLFEADLAGADARVVAWEADDADLKHAFRTGLSVHVKNVRDVFPDKVRGWSDDAIKATDNYDGIYNNTKKAVHATNYGVTPRSIAQALGWLVMEGERFQRTWFGLHPGIKLNFHEGIKRQLAANRTVKNRLGWHRVYFDRIDACFTEALAWVPQSTVALCTYQGAFQLEERYWPYQLKRGYYPSRLRPEGILLQTHDSLTGQFPTASMPSIVDLQSTLANSVPYPDPLIIPWEIKVSTKSWGDVHKPPDSG